MSEPAIAAIQLGVDRGNLALKVSGALLKLHRAAIARGRCGACETGLQRGTQPSAQAGELVNAVVAVDSHALIVSAFL